MARAEGGVTGHRTGSVGEGGVGVRARAGTTIVCVCRRSAANLSWVAVWRERGFSGAANEQPASLELDARVTYLLKLVRESELPGRACAGSHRRNRRILFLSLIRKPRARRAHHHEKHTAHADPTLPLIHQPGQTSSAMPSEYGCCRDAGGEGGEDTAALRVVTVVGHGVSEGG